MRKFLIWSASHSDSIGKAAIVQMYDEVQAFAHYAQSPPDKVTTHRMYDLPRLSDGLCFPPTYPMDQEVYSCVVHVDGDDSVTLLAIELK